MTKKLINKYTPINSTKWSSQAGKFTNNSMVKVELYLPVLNETKITTWEFHVDDSTAGRNGMSIGRDLPTKLGIYLKVSMNTIECGEGMYQGCTTLTENINPYEF